MAGTIRSFLARFLRSVGVSLSVHSCNRAACFPTYSATGRTSPTCRGSTLHWLQSPAPLPVALGVPLGVLLTRQAVRPYANAITQFINLGTTIPTLAILAIAMSFLGIGAPSAIFGLVMLTLLPIVLNTVAGIRMVPAHLIEAARGMGMNSNADPDEGRTSECPLRRFAGLRTALAINVGTVPLAFLIGGGGLGELIFTGIDYGAGHAAGRRGPDCAARSHHRFPWDSANIG